MQMDSNQLLNYEPSNKEILKKYKRKCFSIDEHRKRRIPHGFKW